MGGGAVKFIEFYETVCQYMQCKVHVLTEVFANQSIDQATSQYFLKMDFCKQTSITVQYIHKHFAFLMCLLLVTGK